MVLYDSQTFDIQKFGGISRYFTELMHYSNDWDLSVIYSDNYYLSQDPAFNIKPLGGNFQFKGKSFLQKKINRFYSLQKIKESKFDIFHSTYYDSYFLANLKKPLVITIHDMIYELHYNAYDNPLTISKKQQILAADKIIAISEFTKQDILKCYNVDPNKIEVVYHGNNLVSTHSSIGNKHGRYLLYVGLRNHYKNFINFIKAASILFKREKDLMLVCVGKPFDPDEILLLKELNIIDKTTILSVTDEELCELYKYAVAFVFPSVYEGFGMPILEAFGNNCPVLLSRSSCFPEIAEDAALYFDGNNVDSIYTAIKTIVENNSLRIELVAKGVERLNFFSWDKCNVETQKVYQQLK